MSKNEIFVMVDDDIRNIFALSSVLEEKGMRVLMAKNGKEALEQLAQDSAIDLVLAKAMKGDRQRCMDAGANDYLAKPVDIDKLLSLLRVWLY